MSRLYAEYCQNGFGDIAVCLSGEGYYLAINELFQKGVVDEVSYDFDECCVYGFMPTWENFEDFCNEVVYTLKTFFDRNFEYVSVNPI